MASSGSSWMKVASGARLVASAVLKQSAEETGVAAQRILHHGTDLSSKAQKTANVAMPSQEVLWSILRNVIPDPASSTNSGYGAGDSTSSTMTVKSGMSPYESQLRKKRQREEMITASTAEASDSKHEMSNPYLFHQQAASIQNPPTKTNIDPQSVEGDAISNNPLGEEYQQQDAINNISDKTIESRNDTVQSAPTTTDAVWANDEPTTRLREGQAVPSTRVGRAFGFASLGAGLAWGAVGELSSRLVGG
jgi:hypothetical protein